ncbi:MAG: LytTR family DNA-binding domain-containing protein [Erysipelotrichaceae bacterium]
MNKINIGLCDDDNNYIESLMCIINDFFDNSLLEVNIYVFYDGVEFINSNIGLDLLFLDIEMSNLDGIAVKKILEKQHSKCKIVFVSNFENRMIDAYGLNVIAFINKKNIKDIAIYLDRIEKEYYEHKIISFGTHKIDAFDIMYIKADGSYSNIFGNTRDYICCVYLAEILERLKGLSFIRVHRSYVVNLYYIRDIINSDIVLLNGDKIPISKAYKDKILTEYFDYIRGN